MIERRVRSRDDLHLEMDEDRVLETLGLTIPNNLLMTADEVIE